MSRVGSFSAKQKRQIRERAGGLCERCGAPGRDCNHMHDLGRGGRGDLDNGELLCRDCHAVETAKQAKARAKIRRLRGETKGRPKRAWPSRKLGNSQWRKKMSGEVVRR